MSFPGGTMEILGLVLPIFGVLLTGLFFAHFKLLPDHTAEILIQFAFKVAIPALLIIVIAQEDVDRLFNLPFIAALGGACLALYLLILLGGLFFRGQKLGPATMLAAVSVASNSGFIALPILHTLFGHKAVLPAAIANVIVVCIFLITIALLEIAEEREKGEREPILVSVKRVAFNPVIYSTVIGIAWAITGLPVPKVLADYLDVLAAALTPCALFAIGMSIRLDELKKSGPAILFASVVKLIVLPVIVLLLSQLFGLSPLLAVAAVVAACVPTAKTTYMLANQYGQKIEPVADTISVTTIFSVGTMFVWLVLLSHLYPSLFHGG